MKWTVNYCLDFNAESKSPFLGWVLLALGSFACCVAMALYAYSNNLKQEAEVLKEKIRRTESALLSSPIPVAADEGLRKRWLQAAQHMNMPWHHLFLAFETVPDKNIILLSFEPEATQGTVRVTGFARSLTHLQRYIEQLAQTQLHQVILLAYQQTGEGENQLKFVLQAQWFAERTPQ
jgi:hypothetical protein